MQKRYNPAKPLISLHITKCGGQSLNAVLKGWFGECFRTHYFQKHNRKPDKYPFEGPICIHGHFNNAKGFGALQYYPTADQFITFLRDPMEMAISNYFFWKRIARGRQLKLGIIEAGGEHDYRDIDDFFRKRSNSHLFDFIPFDIDAGNYRQIIRENFIFIGLTEAMQRSIDRLSEILGFIKVSVPQKNVSLRDAELSENTRKTFLRANKFAFEFYQYARELFYKA